MRNAFLAVLLALVLLLGGCAFTDRILLDRKKSPDGVELFIDNKTGEETVNAVDASGKPNEPAYESRPSGSVTGFTSLLRLFGPWGDVAGYGAGALVTLYAVIRGKRAVSAALARKAAIAKGMELVAMVIADWRAGVIDADKDGVVSMSEIGEYIKAKAKAALTPEGISAIIKIVSDSLLTDAQRQAKLEDVAAEL